ncbi:MAG: hypothetical protein HY265_07740, partial [Deltaproteobacteria bacterium]|nr:hypothetical protein [Deltaproteobacteria bacterium]
FKEFLPQKKVSGIPECGHSVADELQSLELSLVRKKFNDVGTFHWIKSYIREGIKKIGLIEKNVGIFFIKQNDIPIVIHPLFKNRGFLAWSL